MTPDPALALQQALLDASPYLLPENTLFSDVCNRLTRPITRLEFDTLLAKEAEARRITAQRTGEGTKWRLSDQGHAGLASRRAALRRGILAACANSLVRETVLQTQIAEDLSPAPTLAELQTELGDLQLGGYLKRHDPNLGGPSKVMATDLGRAALQG